MDAEEHNPQAYQKGYHDFCMALNIDQVTRTSGWELLLEYYASNPKVQYTQPQYINLCKADEKVWYACAIYLLSCKVVSDNVTGVSLSQLLKQAGVR